MSRIKHIVRSLTLRAKLLASFSILVVIIVSVSLFNNVQVSKIDRHLGNQNDKVSLQLMALELKVVLQDMKDTSSGLMISRDLQYKDKFEQQKKTFSDLLSRMSESAATDDQYKWRSQLLLARTEFFDTFDRAVNLIQNKSLTETDIQKNTDSLYREAQTQRDAMFALVDNFYRDYTADAEKAVAASSDKIDQTSFAMIEAAVIVLVLTILISYWLIVSFTRPIRRLRQAMAVIAAGDLRHTINAESNDELGQLSHSFDDMIEQVRRMLGSTQTIASSLAEHSMTFRQLSVTTAAANADILKAIEEISAGADHQAQRTETSAQVIVELEGDVHAVWDAAQEMQRMNRDAEQTTEAGAAAVRELNETAQLTEAMIAHVLEAMRTLSVSSSRIGGIVKTMTEISGQTHILSLNAAIEAARAGAHGRGFAVVAEEVRSLAAEAGVSSKSIAGIVVDLQRQIGELEARMEQARSGLAQQNGKVAGTLTAFSAIREAMLAGGERIERIGGLIRNAKEQNKRLMESVHFVAAVAEETAAGVEEVGSTSYQQDVSIRLVAEQADDIHRLSQQLFAEVSRFRIGDEDQDGGGSFGAENMPPEAAAPIEQKDEPNAADAETAKQNDQESMREQEQRSISREEKHAAAVDRAEAEKKLVGV
ncbi:MAG: methyl-accepting chemotaxis protein [Paenibacillaceae bacterium]|nr:methyl-accepting chemotaxis protein [Paenibacillaceae bacterium]